MLDFKTDYQQKHNYNGVITVAYVRVMSLEWNKREETDPFGILP